MTKRAAVPKETPQARAERLIDLQLDLYITRSKHLRKALRLHAATVSPMARQMIIDYLDRNHALTIARITQASEIDEFEFPPRLDDEL